MKRALLARLCWIIGTTLFFIGEGVGLADPPRPVVVIPGILGSRLCDGEEMLWGGRASYRKFSRLALPLDPDATTVRPCGIIDEVRILGPWKAEKYEPLLERLEALGYREGQTLFVFPYDWRRSNFDSADELRRFVDGTSALAQSEFDIVAHSMGGIVARIYLDRHSGADRVHSLVTLGTPHRGSLKILEMLLSGFGGLGNFLAGGTEEVRQVTFTFPSAFELLPFYDNCCVHGLPGNRDRRVFDIFDERYWLRAWAPREYRSGPRGDRIREFLAMARELRELLLQPVSPAVELYAFAGDFIDTLSQVYVHPRVFSPEVWRHTNGDGSVLVASAAAGLVAQARVSFSQHSALFRDAHVKTALERILIRPPGPVDFAGGEATIFVRAGSDQGLIPIERLAFEVTPSYVEPGGEVNFLLELRALPSQPARGIEVQGWIEAEDGTRTPITIREDPSRRSGDEDPAAYFIATVRPSTAGNHRVIVSVPGLDKELEEFFAVVPPAGETP
jgi:pimeloyl-ACP methyl ester carboxylesterase